MENRNKQKSTGAIGVLDKITGALFGVSCVILVALTLITFLDVTLRLTRGSTTRWGFSVTVICMMWLVLFALPMNIRNNDQITVTLLISIFSDRTRAVLRIICSVVSFLFLLVLCRYGMKYTVDAFVGKMTSSDLLSYPMWILRAAFPLCTFFGCLQIIRVACEDIIALRRGTLEKKAVWYDSPLFIVPLMLLLILGGLFLISRVPMLGIAVLILLLLFAGAPIAFGMGFIGSAVMFLCYNGTTSLALVPSIAEPMLTNFIMLAVPMFLFAGIILEKTGIGEILFDFCADWFGFLPGGLAVATILACALFSAMTGVSMAVAATISIIAVKALTAHNYPKELIYGSIGGGALGSFIPPSIGLVLYGYMTGKSVGKLFMAAAVPAIIVVILYVSWAVFYAVRDPGLRERRIKDRENKTSLREKLRSLVKAIPSLMMPVICLGGIYTGKFTPTEASAVLVIYALVLGIAMRKVTLKGLLEMIKQCVAVSSRMMIVAAGANIVTYVITRIGFAQSLAQSIATMDAPRWVICLVLILMYIILGMFFDGMTITILTVPILQPLLPSIGIDPIVFGVLLVMLVETAAITPPVGMNLFVIQSVSKDKLGVIARGNIPFALLLLGATILVMFVPQLALWLPGTM